MDSSAISVGSDIVRRQMNFQAEHIGALVHLGGIRTIPKCDIRSIPQVEDVNPISRDCRWTNPAI
jgi:hypothetical protein